MNEVLYDQTNTVKKLYEVIYNVFGVDKVCLKSKSRRRKYVEARTVFSVIARRRLLMGTVQIGDLINKDHSSITHYTKQHENLYDFDKQYKDLYDMCHMSFEDVPLGSAFVEDKSITIDEKLNIAYIKLATLQDENKRLKKSIVDIKQAIMAC